MLERYVAYLKDNPHGYWFKRRLFGWGWVPVTWQGWVVILAFIAYLLLIGLKLAGDPRPALYLPLLAVGVGVLIAICFWKGEKPRWTWGLDDLDDSSDR